MNIISGTGFPCGHLSNFHPHPFVIDTIECNSMEGFLQSLKFKNIEMQKYVCTLVGRAAKFKGKKKKWWRTQTLWWLGIEIGRHSKEYQQLLDKAFIALSCNTNFRKTLLATKNAVLTHSIGQCNPHRTVLTQQEFCSRLMRIRKQLKEENPDESYS